jgi:hydrogenase nickel incorporation protein HypA/HybF
MHELSLAQNMINQLEELAAEHGAKRVLRVTVIIGPFSGIVADSFAFGFDALKLEKPVIQTTVLDIEIPPPSCRCPVCDHIQVISPENQQDDLLPGLAGRVFISGNGQCPACGAAGLVAEGGDELILKQIEME